MFKIKVELFEKLVNAGLNLKSLKVNSILQQQKDKIVITDGSDLIVVPVETDQVKFTMNITKELKPIISFFKKQKIQDIEVNCETIRAGQIIYNHFNFTAHDEIPTKRDGDFIQNTIGGINIIKEMVKLLPFTSKDEQRYVLNGVAIKDGAIVATDGRRLSRVKFWNDKTNFNVNTKAIENIDNLFKNCSIYIDKDWMLIRTGDMEYYTNDNGNFPNWMQVIPREKTIIHKYTINGSDLFEKVKLLKLKTTKESPKSLTFVFSKDKLTMANEVCLILDIPVKQEMESEELELYIDQNYLDFCKDKKEIKIELISPQNPVIFKYEDVLTVVMPMNKK